MEGYRYPDFLTNKQAKQARIRSTFGTAIAAILICFVSPYPIGWADLLFICPMILAVILPYWYFIKWFQRTSSESVITLTDSAISERKYNGKETLIPCNLIEEIKEKRDLLVIKKKSYYGEPVEIKIGKALIDYDLIRNRLRNIQSLHSHIANT
jgi:hypothetical protein